MVQDTTASLVTGEGRYIQRFRADAPFARCNWPKKYFVLAVKSQHRDSDSLRSDPGQRHQGTSFRVSGTPDA